METTRLVLSLADLEAYDPHARMTRPERRFLCPGCGDTKPRDERHRCLRANVETGLWRCYRCGAAGQLREWWKDRRSTDRERRRAAPKTLSARAPAKEPPKATSDWQPSGSLQPLAGTAGADYLARRGVPAEVAIGADVFFSADWYGRPAVVFLVRDHAGHVVGAQGRHIDRREGPKAHNSPNTGAGVFATPGAWEASALILCEGPIDALSFAAAGFPAVALLGTAYPAWLPRRCAFRRVLLAHDPDAAGDGAAGKLFAVLRSFGARPERLRPNGANDWNDLILAHGIDGLREALTRYLRPGSAGSRREIDEEQADAILRETWRRIGETVPAGAIRWADAHRRELMAAADSAEARLQAAYEAQDATTLLAATADLVWAYEAVAAAFPGRGTARDDPVLLGQERVADVGQPEPAEAVEDLEMVAAGPC